VRALETLVASMIALAFGGGVARMWDHAPVPAPARVLPEAPAPPRFARTFTASRFVRGNLHTHSTRSDGDAAPVDVATWYREHGYGFLAVTDHNALSSQAELSPAITPDFAILPGEEITMRGRGLPVHVNALCTRATIPGGDFPRALDALEYAIGEVRAQGGVALVNHPNFDWALTTEDVVAIDGAQLLEIASGHPYVHTPGDATHLSHEQLWDAALTAGRDVMGVAVDDTHHLVTDADPEAFPAMAWVEVFADAPREGLLCDALRRGALYASTGAVLRSIEVTETTYTVAVEHAQASSVVFVGSGGRVLTREAATTEGTLYVVRGDEGYVRARVETPAGMAWTPAVRVSLHAD